MIHYRVSFDLADGVTGNNSNLDLRQHAMSQKLAKPLDLPILFVTQLVGLAMGLSNEVLGLNRHFVSVDPVVAKVSTKALPAAREEA